MSLLSPQLIAFKMIAQCKTVHAAAEKLNLTQTAVTQRLRTLERSLKSTLFKRTRRGMVLTKEGEALLRYTHAVTDLEGETLASIQGAGIETEIELSISAPTSIMHSRVVPSCLPVIKKFPNLLVHFDLCDTDERHIKLRQGVCDFAIVREEHLVAEMQFKKLNPEQYVLVAPIQWKNRSLPDIIMHERIIDFNEQDHITFNYLRHFDLFKNVQRSRYFINHTENLARLVMAEVGYTTLTKEFVSPLVKAGKLAILNQGQSLDVVPVLVWFDRPEPPQYFTEIIEAL